MKRIPLRLLAVIAVLAAGAITHQITRFHDDTPPTKATEVATSIAPSTPAPLSSSARSVPTRNAATVNPWTRVLASKDAAQSHEGQRIGEWTRPIPGGKGFQRTTIVATREGLSIQTVETIDSPGDTPSQKKQFRAGRALVKLAPGVNAAALESLASAAGAKVGRKLGDQGWYELIGPEIDPAAVERLLAAAAAAGSEIATAEPDYIYSINATPNDPRYLDGSLWGLHNTGQNSGTADADIDAPEAWDIRREAPDVVVAVIDTGINYNHEDLKDNLWTNPGEIPGNGIDDDGNGYIDDVYGINSITGSGDPRDDHGHGSHCAGTIGARGDNNTGITGVTWNVKLMAVKFLNSSGSGAGSDAIESIEYARKMGAHILSNSWGGGPFSTALRDTIAATRTAGQIFVAAAANNAANNDNSPVFPASYNVDNIVAVAATTRADELASYSNFGQGLVHIAAPGSAILSASHSDNTGYVSFNGTSMATPHISGMLALLRAQYPSDNYAASINRLLNSADAKASLAGKVSTGGRANLHTALTSAPATPFHDSFAKPAPITGNAINVRTTNLLATAEPGEPAHAGVATATTTVWYSWIAPATGTFILNTQNSLIDTVAAVYTGTALGSLTTVASNDNDGSNTHSRVEFSATLGTTYRIAIAGKSAAQGLIRFTLSGPPGEDHLANAINLPTFPAFGTGSNLNASKEPGEPDHAGHPGGRSVWAKWTAPSNEPVLVHTFGSAIDTLLAVYSGPATSPTYPALTLIAENDDDTATGRTQSIVRFQAVAGTTYYFATDGKNGAEGALSIRVAAQIPNDNFASRAPIVGDTANISVPDAIHATREVGEPDHGGFGGEHSLWYEWTAPSAGTWRFDTSGSVGIASISAYTGSDLGALVPVASGYLNAPGFGSQAIVEATAGTTYVIAIDNPDKAYGVAKLNLVPFTLPPNDDFADATVLTGTPVIGSPIVATGHNDGASQQLGEPGSAADTLIRSVWWRWTAPVTARFTLTTLGSDFDTVLGVYTGATFNALTTVAENDDGLENNLSTVSFDATAGTTYHFRVYGWGATSGNITLKLAAWQAVANDSFATPHVFTGSTYRLLTVTSEATAEPGEPAHAGEAAAKSVWFQYTATANGTLTVAPDTSSFPTRIGVYIGTALGALTEVASNTSIVSTSAIAQLTWHATAGTTYRIAIDGDSGASGSLRTTFVVGPGNDHFADRKVLGSVSSHTETTYNHGATKEAGEPTQIAGANSGKTLWWSWTAPATGQYEITTEGSTRFNLPSGTHVSLNTLLGVYTGTAVNALTSVVSNDDIDIARGVMTSRVILNATAGTTYQISVAGWSSGTTSDALKTATQGEITFTLRPFQKAANDNLSAATTIASSLPAFFETNNLGLGIQAGEPGTANSPTHPDVNFDADRSKGTAWWKWTAPDSRRYHAATGTLYKIARSESTILSVYSGPASGATFGNLTLIGYDKDSAGGGYSLVSFDATAGQTYYFQVGAASRGELEFMLTPTPANDAFADATILHGSSLTVTGHTLGATFESNEPKIDPISYPKYTSNPPRARSVWWRWTAPATGTVSLDTLGSNIFSVMAVYTGSSLGSLSLVAKDDDAARDPFNGTQPRNGCSELAFSATAGTTYFIQVEGGFSDWPSAGIVKLSLAQSASPVGDPHVTAAALPAHATEGGASGAFVISRTTAPNTPLVINIALSGTATNGEDYETIPGTVTIPAHAYEVTVAVNALSDGLLESASPEVATLTVQSGSGYAVGATASASVSILDPTSFGATAPVLSVAAIGATSLGLEWTFPPADHAQWRLQAGLPAPASQFLYEPFNYSAGAALIGSGAWTEGTGNTSQTAATIAEGNLTSSGFAEPAGRRVALGQRGGRMLFTSNGTVTDVFFSFLLRFDDVTPLPNTTTWYSLVRTEAGGTNGLGIFLRRAGVGSYDLGIHKRANGSAVETSTAIQNLTSGTTYLVVARYRTVSGSNNDAMDLWINPSSSSFGTNSPPTAAFTSVAGTDTAADWSTFALLPPADVIGTIDELRIGSDWAAVTHIPWDTGLLFPTSDIGATLTGLSPSMTRSYRLRAENGSAVSEWSNVASPTTSAVVNATDWLALHFETAFAEGDASWTADPDGDGSSNLLERALGTIPNSAASHALPAPDSDGTHLTLTFTPATTRGLGYIIEASTDLSDWSEQINVTHLLTPGQPYTHTDSANLVTTPRRFLRLRVQTQ